ncbi:MAG TPA: hypothetical protein VLF17_03245 [Candidatus Nitrosotenuis sp.]|nr:hypothetical protein [Candidatus Nitrosotenuis sp.]
MKKSELKKLVSEYKYLQLKLAKLDSLRTGAALEKLGEIKHRYFHETGRDLESDLKFSADSTQ